MKKTLVLGASENTDRFSNRAIHQLLKHGHAVEAIGARDGSVAGVKIHVDRPAFPGIHTVTLYLNPAHQRDYYDYLFSLKPKRIIFNPGTENRELEALASQHGVEWIQHCTLIMLNEGDY